MDRQLRELVKASEKRIRELKELLTGQMKASEKRTRELEELFTGQWGKLIESLVEGDLVNFVIRATGSSASMTNHKDFAPKSF